MKNKFIIQNINFTENEINEMHKPIDLGKKNKVQSFTLSFNDDRYLERICDLMEYFKYNNKMK